MNNAGGIVCDNNIVHDEVFTLSFNLLNKKYSEFQICLPSQGTINSLEIETDQNIKMKYVEPTLILCGSSVASGSSNSQSHHICTMAYRIFNKNYINAGIGGDHSFNCPELMHKVFSTKLPILVMDVFHIKDDILEKYATKRLS